MNDSRPRTDPPHDQTTKRVELDPATTTTPAKPITTGPQPKSPGMGGTSPRVADPKAPAPIVTQGKQ